MIEIPLTQGKTAYIDEIDHDLDSLKWYAHRMQGDNYYAEHTVNGVGKLRLHVLIMERILEREIALGENVSFVDGNTLNCKRGNLRLVDKRQIAQSKSKSPKKTLPKGVRKKGDRYQALISIERKQTHLGMFDTPEQAHEAYKVAAIKHYGEYARFE